MERNDNSNGISITEDIDFGKITLNKTHKLEVVVVNIGKQQQTFVGLDYISFAGLYFHLGPELKTTTVYRNLKENRSVKNNVLSPSMVLFPAEGKILPITFKPEYLGKICIGIEFCFCGFKVSRTITASVVRDAQNTSSPSQKPAKSFFGHKPNTKLANRSMVRVSLPSRLGRYIIPSELKECVMNSKGRLEVLVPELAQPLNVSNYKKKFSTLVYVEELQMEKEMREFDLKSVRLHKHIEFLSLNVPGLAEGRPSLTVGDKVVVSYTKGDSDSPSYEGFVHDVQAASVLLKFNETFQNDYDNNDLDVEFHFNRTSVRREQQSIEHALQMIEVVFPTSIESKPPLVHLKTGKITPFNKLLNERQLTAVSRIVTGCGRPRPYILFGPPGTGKTVTVVESILQIFTHAEHCRILVCTPSNSAADLLAQHLHNSTLLGESDMIRFNAFQRSKAAVPEVMKQYCSKETDDLGTICRHRIIVMTCNMSSYLYSMDLKVGHFTHIFVDEAGQATEPECLIPIGFVAGSNQSQIVLAGDPYQLGPVLRSDISKKYGLNISFLERLMSNKLYARDEELYRDDGNYNPLLVTKLVDNYRSHSLLLNLSSSMFYDSELIPRAAEAMVNVCVGSDLLPNPDSPLIFHGIRSDDQREGNSPSWFNNMEAVQVFKYVKVLLKKFPGKIRVDDIGVITPYRKQVEKIRLLLEKSNLSDIKVGSVEEFQGQERMFIIISTVRSNETLVDFDRFHNIGFLSNPKRFNVSITRAQALLIIIGNPVVLCHDPYWCAMLQYAVMTGSYTGCDLPPLESEIIQDLKLPLCSKLSIK